MSSSVRHAEAPDRMPAVLTAAAILLAAVTAIPTAVLGGRESLAMMGLGAAVGLGAVVSGFYCVRLALRGPDRFGVNAAVVRRAWIVTGLL